MATTQYIGARYIPVHRGQWNAKTQYTALDVVLYTDGNSYTAKCASPAGTLPTNEQYWSLSSNFSQQFANLSAKVDDFAAKTARYKGYFTNENALKQMYPAGELGDFALINETESVWYWDGVKWLDTFTNYYQKSEINNNFFQNGERVLGGTTDFNTIQKAGSYWFGSSTWSNAQNAPNTAIPNIYSYGTLLVFNNYLTPTTQSITQIYLPHHTTGNAVFRIGGSDNKSWREWQKMGKGLTAAEVGAFPNYSVIPLEKGGTGQTSIDAFKKSQGLITKTVVQQTTENGEIIINTPEFPNVPVMCVATSGTPSTSIVQKDPENGRIVLLVYNGTELLKSTNIRVNVIYGSW